MPTPFRRGLEGRERYVVLPSGLADRGTHRELEYVVFAKARGLCRGDVLVGDRVGVFDDLVDQGTQRLGEACVIERGSALGG